MFKNIKRIKKAFFILTIFLFFIFILSRGHIYKKNELEYGITFSQKKCEELNLNWKQVYLAALDELKIKKLRIAAYWDEIEISDNQFIWDDLDWQVAQASDRNSEIILAVGGRLPRWPECHFPELTNGLTKKQREEKTLNYIKEVIDRYKDNKQIVAWQIENEPFLSHFGECPKLDKNFLDAEIALVRKLDNRQIIITDSGELSIWVPAAKRADIFGTTMYRDTYSKHLKRYIHYPIAPGFFRFKQNIAKIFANPKKWIVIELQAEPWGPKAYHLLSQEDRDRTMTLQKFKEIIEFASKTGFKEFYLWGVEYWYWERAEGRAEMWNEAMKLF